MRLGDRLLKCTEDALRVAVPNQAEPTSVLQASPGIVGGGVLTAGILKHDLAPDAWASLEGTESSPVEAGAAKGTRCQGHPGTCKDHKHGSCEAAQRCQDHHLCLPWWLDHLLIALTSG